MLKAVLEWEHCSIVDHLSKKCYPEHVLKSDLSIYHLNRLSGKYLCMEKNVLILMKKDLESSTLNSFPP